MMKIMLFFKQTWFMSCVHLIFSFALWKNLKSGKNFAKRAGEKVNVERKHINLKGNAFCEKFAWASNGGTSKGRNFGEYYITLSPSSYQGRKVPWKISRIQVCSVCDDKLNLFNFLWFHSRVDVWATETWVNIIFACLRGRGAVFKHSTPFPKQSRRAKIPQ